MIRAVLDTNGIISALLFSGPPSKLVPAWQAGRLRPIISANVLDEYLRVLAYPKFRLTPTEILAIIEEEVLPFVETMRVTSPSKVIPRDPDDAKFIDCALAAKVKWLISGDADLLDLLQVESVTIVPVTLFLQRLKIP